MLTQALQKQYDKSLNILAEAIGGYDEKLWYDDKAYKSPAWQVAYHALFYANIYASAAEKGIRAWPKARENYQFFGKTPWPPFDKVILEESYSKSDILEFLAFVRENIPRYLEEMRPEERCWPHWYDETQLEFHINNLRHIQHHCGELIERHDIFGSFAYRWQ
jgi:hypothetical protein